jgi:hypothetical protein
MSTLEKGLPVIERLRAERDRLDQRAYTLRTRIARVRTALRQSRVSAGRMSTPSQPVIAAGRQEIADHEARLRGLANAAQAALSTQARVEEARRHQEFLIRSLAALATSVTELQALLAREENTRPIDRKKVAAAREALERAQAQQADVQRSLEKLRADEQRREAEAAAARDTLRQVEGESEQLRAAIVGKESEIGMLRDVPGVSTPELERQLTALTKEYTATKSEWRTTRDRLHETIKGVYVDPHPRTVVAQMPDTTPFLLLPLRIETRFVIRPNTAAPAGDLLVRVYPDDIAIHTHESTLTDREVSEGERYWRAIFAIETGTATNKPALKTESWKTLAALFGPSGAAWVARSTRPTNWAAFATLASADELVFPVHDLTKTAQWSRAPRTHVLPDRIVVLLYHGETVREVVGNPIPDELIVGPDPLELEANADQPDVEDSFVTVDGKLTFGAAFDWVSNFEKAVEQGMGFRIPISGGEVLQGFDKILVLGVMASADTNAGAGMLETLLGNHHHSPKSLTLLRQGTATNNLDGQGSGYSVNDTLDQTKEVSGLDTPLFTAQSDVDGRVLADALGIGHETLHFVYGADNTDGREAVAMNRALYPATLGYYFDSLLPVIPEAARDRLREFFVTHVTGRGPLSSIRIGDQPYGILLTSDFTRFTDGDRRDRFLSVIHAVLQRFDVIWQAILPELAFAGKPGLSTVDALLSVLGLQAASTTFAQRIGYSRDYLVNLTDFAAGDNEFSEIIGSALKEFGVTEWLRTLGYEPGGVPPANRPQLLRLIYQHYTTRLNAANLVDAVPLSETAGIREYAPARNYLHWLRDANTLAILSAQNFDGAAVPTALLYLKLRHALLLQLHRSSVDWLAGKGYDASMTLAPRTFHNIRPQSDLTKWELMSAPVSAVGSSASAGKVSVADYVMSPAVTIDAAAYLTQMREALDVLADLPTARLERCFVEHLDSCTYRLDAWQSALFKTRLDQMRATTKVGQRGTYLGAFGWVENVKPAESSIAAIDVPKPLRPTSGPPLREYTSNGGFIHAPSINHATAAALLRSGYMSHATPEQPELLSVNISSERVRRALFILQGMRNGQAIEALLGYQFERSIHDRASRDASLAVLNGFIFDIRIAFPVTRTRLGPGEAGGAEETVESYDVVNGVTLVETANPDWAAITNAPPATLTPARLAALNEARDDVANTVDAIKDLLLAESAYQLVQGNFDRAGAVLGSIKEAQPPPDLDVIRTPRSSHFTFTQRAAIHVPSLDSADPAAAAWPAIPMTPRAVLEPGVNQWLGQVLNAPDAIVFTVFEVADDEMLANPQVLTAANLGLQPIDLVYVIGADIDTGLGARTGASELESRVAWHYRVANGLDETASVRIRFSEPKNQAGTVTMAEAMPLMRALQSVLSDSRPLDARDYHTTTIRGPASSGPAATPLPGFDFEDLRVRTAALRAQLEAVVSSIFALPFTGVIDGWSVATLQEAFDVLSFAEVGLLESTFTFTASDALALQELLIRLAGFGIADAFPRTQDVTRTDSKIALVLQAMDATSAASTRLTASTSLLGQAVAADAVADARATSYGIDACKAILGNNFAVIPRFALPNEAEVLQSHADRAQLMDHATNVLGMEFAEEEWLRSVAYVRPKVAAWERIRLLHETLLGTTLGISAVQLPYRGGDSWLAVTLPDVDAATGEPFDIAHDTLSMVIHGDSAFAAGSLRCGIVIDSWTETVPAREQNTGIAFHYNRPDAMPPQALLLAVPPVMTGHWTWDALVNIVNDTLRRAKLRAVEPHLLDAHKENAELSVLLPAIISEFQQYDLNVSLDLRLNLVLLTPVLMGLYANPNIQS